ncbi:MAG: penicillin-binding protein 2 [Burkholderiales bacterium]|nr:penicillin-binding protein 2 [Burkholderiales bacterium]
MPKKKKNWVGIHLRMFRGRSFWFVVAVVALYALLIGRFFYLQVIEYEEFSVKAEANRKTEVAHAPRRGIIVDKHGELLAANEPSYTLEVTPAKVGTMGNTLEELGHFINISKADVRRFNKFKDELPRLSPVPIKLNLSDEEVARFTAQSWRFPGVEVRSRLHRYYPQGKDAAHIVGYLGRISQKDQNDIVAKGKEAEYSGTLDIGKIGLELSYEDVLHGKPGIEELEVRASGRPIRSLSRSPSTTGSNLTLTLDMRLQREITKELGERRGAVVAIEPATGDILAVVSNPSFDPNLFVDGIDQDNWDALNKDPDKPLLNRALRGAYPIGSTIKPFLAISAAQLGVRSPKRVIQDGGTFRLGDHIFRDSTHGRGYGAVDMRRAIIVSSDVYFYSLAQEMGIDKIHDSLKPFGFGQITGVDLKNEGTGILPSKDWKWKRFKQRWMTGDTISVGIGQGYNAFTMLQLAHAVATLANDGVVMTPHFVKKITDPTSGEETFVDTEPTDIIPLKREYLDLIKGAMHEVTIHGTGRGTFGNAPYSLGGKTGTAQVLGVKQGAFYDKNRVQERHRDHSLFIAFAPFEKPTIAIACIIENGGFGASAAAPLVRKILDFYFDEKKKEEQGTLEPDEENKNNFRDYLKVQPAQPAQPEEEPANTNVPKPIHVDRRKEGPTQKQTQALNQPNPPSSKKPT